jgi:hypothetical protein
VLKSLLTYCKQERIFRAMEQQQAIHPERIEEQPSLYGELQLLHSYADQERFSTTVLRDKWRYYYALSQDPTINNRALGDVKVIFDNLSFELQMRAAEA